MKLVVRIVSSLVVLLSAASARADGTAAIYEKKCATCHGLDGKGRTRMGEKLGIKELAAAAPGGTVLAADVEKVIRDGKGRMPGFKEKLSDAEMKDLAAYVASGLGRKAPPDGGSSSPK